MRRPALTLIIAGALVAVSSSPAYAHPLTGGPATPSQVAVTALSALLMVGGVVVMVKNTRSGKEDINRSQLRKVGIVTVFLGLASLIVGPDLVGPSCTRPETQATIKILSPTTGQTVGTNVEVSFELTGGKLADIASTSNIAGEGHLHLSVDGRLASMTGENNQTLELPPGQHELEAEYVANDHAPFCNRVAGRTSFTVT